MKLEELRPAEGSTKTRKRVGRGHGSGTGKTSGKGQKGQNSRSGSGKGPGFEGGQNPIQRRLPKLPGFRNINRVEYQPVNVADLDAFEKGTEVGPELLRSSRLVRNKGVIKILGHGEITKNLTVKANAFSKTAIEKIEAAGGKAEIISV